MKFIIYCIAFAIIYAACDLYRGKDSKIKFGTKEWFIQSALVILGAIIIASVD